ncbi:MAG: DUF1801 domain-containing protein [Candidatus Lutibacillus vidarii]|nr:DUF1801 domain-containing protein [Candidatus Lutibacillus vidarii]
MATAPTTVPVADFLARVPNPVRRSDAEVLVGLMQEITGQPPVMWGPSIIGFGHLRYRYESGREGSTPGVAFSPRSNQLVLYVLTQPAADDVLLDRLGKHTTGKVCLNIVKLADVDLSVLGEVIRRAWVENTTAGHCVVCH